MKLRAPRKTVQAAVWLSFASMVGSMVGCAVETNAPSTSAESLGIVDTSTVRDGNVLHRVTQYKDGHFLGEVLSLQGEILETADFRNDSPKSTVATLAVPLTAYSARVRLTDGAASVGTIRDFLKFSYEQLSDGKKKFDKKGCDIPAANLATSCSQHGACCDVHDDCFYANHCSAWSWGAFAIESTFSWMPGFSYTACSQCNSNVISCLAGGTVGPSTCCACAGNGHPNDCGQDWPYGDDYSHGIAQYRGTTSRGVTFTCNPEEGKIWDMFVTMGGYTNPYQGGTGGGGGTCFVAGTPVSMADGTTKAIEDLVVGDNVLSFNERTGQIEPHRVSTLFSHPYASDTNPLVAVNSTLRVTANHAFYVKGKWVHAGDLRLGDSLTMLNGDGLHGRGTSLASVASLLSVRSPVSTVYNIEVDEAHTYFAGGVLVHNRMKETPPRLDEPIDIGNLLVTPGGDGFTLPPCAQKCLDNLLVTNPECESTWTTACDDVLQACVKVSCGDDREISAATTDPPVKADPPVE